MFMFMYMVFALLAGRAVTLDLRACGALVRLVSHLMMHLVLAVVVVAALALFSSHVTQHVVNHTNSAPTATRERHTRTTLLFCAQQPSFPSCVQLWRCRTFSGGKRSAVILDLGAISRPIALDILDLSAIVLVIIDLRALDLDVCPLRLIW